MTRRIAPLIALATLAAALSCGRAAMEPNYARIDLQKQEIQDLHMQISAWRVDIGLRPQPTSHLIQRYQGMPRSSIQKSVCELEGDPPEQCFDVCNLSEAICDNADSICRIADDLGDDAWARDKCDSAKASCKEAQKRCCGCQERVE